MNRTLLAQGSIRDFSDVFVRRDGAFFPAICSASPIVEQGAVIGFVAEVRDVTREVEAQKALRESEERYRLVSRAANDAIGTWPPERWCGTTASSAYSAIHGARSTRTSSGGTGTWPRRITIA